MKNIIELFTGTAVIIDNAFEEEENNGDQIWQIKGAIEKNNIPIKIYVKLPEDEEIPHFQNLSFLILDWELLPSVAEIANNDDNIDFLKKVNAKCFLPIFIFSKQAPEAIIEILKRNGIYKSENGNIFVKSKGELVEEESTLFQVIENWVKNTPSIYVLKEWELALNKAKKDLFTSLNNINPNWPSILKTTFDNDSLDSGNEIVALISRNLTSRMELLKFDNEIIQVEENKILREEISLIIENERYIKNELLNSTVINTGDLYYKKGKYYLNIRPTCDLIPRNGNVLDDIEVYCLRGSKLTGKQVFKAYSEDYGNFIENETNAIVFPIDDGKAVEFGFKQLYRCSFAEIKNNRKGRLLPPYLTKIQQKYSHYLQRPGLTRIPIEAIPPQNVDEPT